MAQVQADACLAVVFLQSQRKFGVKTIQHARTAHEPFDLAAQGLQQARQFRADIPPTHHGHARRRGVELEEIIGYQAVLGAGNPWPLRPRARGDHDMRRTQAHTFGCLHRVRTQQVTARADRHDAVIVKPLAIIGVDVADVALPMDDELAPVQNGCGDVESKLPAKRDALGNVRGQPHRLLRHAAGVDAGAAQFARFQQRHPRTVAGGAECGG